MVDFVRTGGIHDFDSSEVIRDGFFLFLVTLLFEVWQIFWIFVGRELGEAFIMG